MTFVPFWHLGRGMKNRRDPALHEAIRSAAEKGLFVVLYYVDVLPQQPAAEAGVFMPERRRQRIGRTLAAIASSLFATKGTVLGVHPLWGNDYAVYVAFVKGTGDEDVRRLSVFLEERLALQLRAEGNWRQTPGVRVGFSVLPGGDLLKERYASLKYAADMAQRGQSAQKFVEWAQFQRILAREEISVRFMPIVSLQDGQPLGWEALARGPENTVYSAPDRLFASAEETGTLHLLERVCRKRAFEHVRLLQPDQKLFVNLDPRVINDPYPIRVRVLNMLESCGLTPQNIVFEITERHAIANYPAFRKTLDTYRKKGYLVAVDDAGAGYSSLESITEIHPDFIKLDMSLIRNIHLDTIKQALVETMVQFADKVKCRLIAEGIESSGELASLIGLGVPFGQGYFLGKPSQGMTYTSGEAMNVIRLMQEKPPRASAGNGAYALIVGHIATRTEVARPTTKVRMVHELFEQNQRIDCIVVTEEDRPVGLVMRSQFYQVLGGPYGKALYFEQPIAVIMDKSPSLVKTEETVGVAAHRAMQRNARLRYDALVVVDEAGRYVGVVTVGNLLDKLAAISFGTTAGTRGSARPLAPPVPSG